MGNLKFLDNVIHQGISIKKDMIVDDAKQELSTVALNLIDRGLAQATQEAATHTLALVNTVQEPLPVTGNESAGQTPKTEADEARKAEAQAQQQEADKQTQNEVNDQADKEAEVKTVKRGIFGRGGNQPEAQAQQQPTPEQVAADAANVQ